MTEQVRLSGDAPNDAGLDDSLAFSRYAEAAILNSERVDDVSAIARIVKNY